MVDTDTIELPVQNEEEQQNEPQQPTPGDDKLRLLHTAIGKQYNLGTFDEFKQKIQDSAKRRQFFDAVGKEYNLGNYDDFEKKIGIQSASVSPEHEMSHTPIQDLRHLNELANQSVRATVSSAGTGAPGIATNNPEDVARNKKYQDQYDQNVTNLSKIWGTDVAATKQTLKDFPDEQDENKLKGFATLSKENPIGYARLKNGNDIRMNIAKSDIRPGTIDPGLLGTRQGAPHENNATGLANAFNDLQNFKSFEDMEAKIPLQQQMIRMADLGPDAMDKLRETQRPLINSLDPGLLSKYWNGPDKELGLTTDEFAGLETERLFNPNKARMDEGSLKHSRGIGEDGKANPLDLSTQSYEYRRGLENIKYNLEQTGRQNTAMYVSEHKGDIDKQVDALKNEYQSRINSAPTQQDQQQLIQEFANHPLVQEANKLEDAAQGLQYSQNEDQRRYPLNFSDQATRAVADAMDHTTGFVGNAAKFGGNVLQGAGESADNTMRWIKNTAINLVANDQYKSFNNAKNIGHQALTELSAYEPTSYTGQESPLIVPRGIADAVQGIFKDPDYTDSQKEQHAISYIRDNMDQLQVNPKAGQQNLTGKAALFQAANVMGQILGIANQSFLLGGVVGDASKLQQMATAFTPMYMTTQNQMYEQALKNGDEHPLLKSNIDAAIISLASLINPDLKVVKGMVGADTGIGKMIAGIDESTWNKVLSSNRPILDRTIAAAKATGRQLGLANLQYGVMAPTAQYLAHKSILNEDANLGDMIKDGVIQTNISMALPALLHGVWGGIRATEVNPNQKYSIVEAGLHPDQNIDLIESKIKSGAISEIQGHEMKQLVKHAGEILQNTEMVKTDGTPMNENEVADVTYNMLRKRVLEGKMKTASEPVKPIIEEKIHEINKDIADLHTSEEDKHKNELNQLLHDNLDRIRDKIPTMEQPIKDAIAENRPEDVFKEIASQASETTKVDGKEVSSRSLTEEIFGKPLVEKAIELSKQKTKENGKTNEAEAGNKEALLGKEEGAANVGSVAPSLSVGDNVESTHFEGTQKVVKVSEDGKTVFVENPQGQHHIHEIPVEDITIKPKQDAIQEPSPGGVLQHSQEGDGGPGGESGRVEQGQQGKEATATQPQTGNAGAEIPEGPQGTRISKQGIEDQYGQKFAKTKIGWNEVSQNAMDDLAADAQRKGTSVEHEAEVQVTKMAAEISKNKLTVSENRIVSATAHLMNLDERIDSLQKQNAGTPEEMAALGVSLEKAVRDRDVTLKVLDALGTKSGRNLGLFAGVFSKNDDGGITITRRKIEAVLGIKVPETEKELDANKGITKYEKDKVRPYVKRLEEIKKELDAAKKKAPTKTTTIAKADRKKTSDGLRSLAKKVRTSTTLDKLGLGGSAAPGADTMGLSANVKENLAKALEHLADGLDKGIDFAKSLSDAIKKFGSDDEDGFKGLLNEAIEKAKIPKTNADRLVDAKDMVSGRIESIRQEISDKERKLKEQKKPLNEDQELRRLKEDEKSLSSLRDKYLPEEPDKYENEKAREKIKDKLFSDIIDLNDQINSKTRNKTKDVNKFVTDPELRKLRFEKKNREELLDELDPNAKEEHRLKSAMDSAQRDLDEYERRIKNKDTRKRGKTELFETPALKAIRVKRDAAKAIYDKMVETGIPPREEKRPFDVRQDSEDAAMLWANKKTKGQLNQLTAFAEDANRKWYDKALDWRRSFLIGGIKTLGRVGLSGVSKVVVDPIVKQTTGRLAGLLPGMRSKTSLSNAAAGFEGLVKFKTDKAAIKYADGKLDALEKATTALEDSNKKLKGIRDPEEKEKYELTEHRKIQNEYKKAELENGEAEIYRYIHGNALIDAKELAKYGSTDFEQAMGGYTKNDPSALKGADKALYYISALNRLHGVEKNPSARRALVETYNSKLEEYQKEGEPLTASTRMRALDMAYGAFLSGKYADKTQLVDYVNERKYEGQQPGASAVKKSISTFLRVALPVAKIGVNIVKSGIDMSTVGVEGVFRYMYEANKGMKLNESEGLQYKGLMNKFIAGAERIPEKDKDYIHNVISKGLFGLGLMLYAANRVSVGAIQYGGQYQEGEPKRKYKDEDGKWQELPYGSWAIEGKVLNKFQSSLLNHLPEFLPIAMVVNTHNVYQYEREYEGSSGRRETKDASDAFWSAMKSDVNEINERLPYKSILKPADLAKSLISLPLTKDIGEFFDKDENGNVIERKPKSIIDNVEMNIPGLRQNVQTAEESKKQKGGSGGGGGAGSRFETRTPRGSTQ